MAKEGQALLLVSELLTQELAMLLSRFKNFLRNCRYQPVELVTITVEASNLQKAYLKARVVSAKASKRRIARAPATVPRADLILSWNFKHIVHWNKIKGFNSVNLL